MALLHSARQRDHRTSARPHFSRFLHTSFPGSQKDRVPRTSDRPEYSELICHTLALQDGHSRVS
jgi:hypothetical protein